MKMPFGGSSEGSRSWGDYSHYYKNKFWKTAHEKYRLFNIFNLQLFVRHYVKYANMEGFC